MVRYGEMKQQNLLHNYRNDNPILPHPDNAGQIRSICFSLSGQLCIRVLVGKVNAGLSLKGIFVVARKRRNLFIHATQYLDGIQSAKCL